MRILYSAIDQSVPGAHGGAVHVTSVAEGLAARGHDVHVLATRSAGASPSAGPIHWLDLRPPFALRQLRFLRASAVERVARHVKPDAIIERYYNFGGEAVLAAHTLGIFSVLEVNAPVIDYPGSPKATLDRLLLVEPMRRWREWQCRHADLIVTPSARILPDDVPASRVLEVEWGADTTRFQPARSGRGDRDSRGGMVVIFVGAFRAWHGAIHLIEAMRQLQDRGRRDVTAVLVGDGPELPRVRQAAAGLEHVRFLGPLPHDEVPAVLAGADVGVAPFDVAAHPPLAQEFYWSPLKVFEYMASGLPVVAPRIPRLETIVRHEQEGLLYDAADPQALSHALERLSDVDLRQRLGDAARARVVDRFSWARHCEHLETAIQAGLSRKSGVCAS